MSASPTVVVVGSRDSRLQDLLRASGMRTAEARESALAAAAGPAGSADVLVLDLRGRTELPAALSAFKRQHSSIGIVIVADRLDPSLMLEAMRAGVSECIVEPVSQQDLAAAVARLTANQAVPTAGRAFAFVGAKGGVGATTVAVNVATVLAAADPGGTLFADLHLTYGDAGVYFGAEPRFSVVDAFENLHRLDRAFFSSLIVRTKAGPDLLASSTRALVAPVEPRRVQSLIEFAIAHYRYVVLDVPRLDPAALDALEPVSTIVIVASQELAAVRSASRLAAALRHRYGRDKVAAVVSRSDRLAEIDQDDVEKAVAPVKQVVPSEYRLALQALNRGQPISVDNHNRLAGAFTALARELGGLGPSRSEAGRSGLFGRFKSER